MKKYLLIAALSVTSLLTIAQDAQAPKTDNPFTFLLNIFSPKPAKLTKLIDEKNLTEADEYLANERQYFFVENKKEHLELLKRLGVALNAMYEPEMNISIAALSKVTDVDPGEWGAQREIIKTSEALVSKYKKQTIFSEQEFRSQKLAQLEATVLTKKSALDLAASAAFAKFDHGSPESFFALYPQPLADNFLSENAFALQGFIKTLSIEQITQLKSKYPEKTLSGGPFNDLLADRFLEVSLPASSAPHSIGVVLEAIKSTKSAGLTIKSVPGAEIAFVEVTSKTLLSEGQIEFPTQIEMDLPFAPVKADVDSVLDATQKAGANFVIILDVAASKVSRRIVAKNDISSRFVSGFRSDPNPAYEVARSKLFDSQNSLANARSQSSYGLLAGVLNGVAVAMWSSNVKDAQQTLSNTPAMVKSDEHQSYKYSSSDITASRILTANYYVIDKTKNRYYKGTFDISENKSFKIAYNLHDKDPERGTILSQFSKESDLASYERSPMILQASLLIEDYLKNEAKSKTPLSIVALRDEMLADKNKALIAYKSTQFNAKPINDSRFDSVVVMNNPKGAIGTGFFVTPDLVMTNYHVIEGAQFIEMKLYNGLETFGKIVKSDVRLDLALVRVQTRGTPVSFFQSNTLDLGATVEAIGHPKGLTFTITRGIVSAVRKKPSIFGVGGKEVLFVQTDAAINPGNSGGPLFLGDKVIGVNNNKMVAGSEGLGFSIHYSEVQEFLKESF